MASGRPAFIYPARAKCGSIAFPARFWIIGGARAAAMALADLRALAARYGAGTPGTPSLAGACSNTDSMQAEEICSSADTGTLGTPGTHDSDVFGGIAVTKPAKHVPPKASPA